MGAHTDITAGRGAQGLQQTVLSLLSLTQRRGSHAIPETMIAMRVETIT